MLAYKRKPLLQLSLSIAIINNSFPEVSMSKWRNSRRYVLVPSLHSAYISNVHTRHQAAFLGPARSINTSPVWVMVTTRRKARDGAWRLSLVLVPGIVWCHDSCSDNQHQIPGTTSHSCAAASFWVDGGWRYHLCTYNSTPQSSIHNIRLSWRLFCQSNIEM